MKRLDEMTIGERAGILAKLSEWLILSAKLAKGDGDVIWRPMEDLANRLMLEGDAIAGGSDLLAAKAVTEAVRLLGRFERSYHVKRRTLH